MRAWVGLYTAGLGFCGPCLVCRLGAWTVGLAQKPGPHGLRLLVYVVKARARMSGLGLGITEITNTVFALCAHSKFTCFINKVKQMLLMKMHTKPFLSITFNITGVVTRNQNTGSVINEQISSEKILLIPRYTGPYYKCMRYLTLCCRGQCYININIYKYIYIYIYIYIFQLRNFYKYLQ
jgi:hypothetical protein